MLFIRINTIVAFGIACLVLCHQFVLALGVLALYILIRKA